MDEELSLIQSRARKLKASELRDVRNKIMAHQKNKCAICSKALADGDWCLDHDHKTGFIRGVLCRNCNRGEGKVRTISTICKRGGTQIGWLSNLLAYLLLHRVPQSNFIHPTHKTETERVVARRAEARARYKRKKET